MPVRMTRLPGGKVRVSTPGGVKAKATTPAKAAAQKRIIEQADRKGTSRRMVVALLCVSLAAGATGCATMADPATLATVTRIVEVALGAWTSYTTSHRGISPADEVVAARAAYDAEVARSHPRKKELEKRANALIEAIEKRTGTPLEKVKT